MVHAQSLWHLGWVTLKHVGSFQTWDKTCVPCIARQILNHCTTGEAEGLKFLMKWDRAGVAVLHYGLNKQTKNNYLESSKNNLKETWYCPSNEALVKFVIWLTWCLSIWESSLGSQDVLFFCPFYRWHARIQLVADCRVRQGVSGKSGINSWFKLIMQTLPCVPPPVKKPASTKEGPKPNIRRGRVLSPSLSALPSALLSSVPLEGDHHWQIY